MHSSEDADPSPAPAGNRRYSKQAAPMADVDQPAAPQRANGRRKGGARPTEKNASALALGFAELDLADGVSANEVPKRTLDDEGQWEDGIKVASQSRVNGLAGALAHRLREKKKPTLLAAGNNSINQAVKSVAVARKYLQDDGLDVAYIPVFRSDDHGRALLALEVVEHVSVPKDDVPEAEDAELKVSGHSRHSKVGGAIAARVREGKRVQLVALGVDAVANAVMATCHARFYLEKDLQDLKVLPDFVTIQREGRELVAVKLTIVT